MEQVEVPKWHLFLLCSGSHLEKHSAWKGFDSGLCVGQSHVICGLTGLRRDSGKREGSL